MLVTKCHHHSLSTTKIVLLIKNKICRRKIRQLLIQALERYEINYMSWIIENWKLQAFKR